MRVLVADDDEIARALLRAVLEDLGHEVTTAPDGADAWARFQEEPAPLVVLDVQMPRLDGLEVCRRIRASDAGRETFVLVVTALDGAEDMRSVLDAGADDYLAKPTSPENLRARLTIAERRLALDAARRATEDELRRARWLAGIGETTIALQHEINNPLSALTGYAELLLMEPVLDGEVRAQVEVVLAQARRIAEVMRRLAAIKNPTTVEYVGGSKMLDLRAPSR